MPLSRERPITLKPVDVAVALDLAVQPASPYAILATRVGISVGEAHNSVKRLTLARLVRGPRPHTAAGPLLEFLIHGVKYAFPAEPGAESRGIPTAHSGPPLAARFQSAAPYVWPHIHSNVLGAALAPLYGNAVYLPQINGRLYELLTVVDALRVGQAREREMATEILRLQLLPLAER